MLSYQEFKERSALVEGAPTSGLRFFVEFVERDPERAERERALLEARCNCSRVPVHIDGFQIAKGWSRIFGNPTLHTPEQRAALRETPIILDGETLGVAGMHMSETEGAFMRLLVNGVQIEDVQIHGQWGFRAIVEAELRRDLSQSKVIRDERFDAIAAAVAEVHGRTLDALVAASSTSAAEPEPDERSPLIPRQYIKLGFIGIGVLSLMIGILTASMLLALVGFVLFGFAIFASVAQHDDPKR